MDEKQSKYHWPITLSIITIFTINVMVPKDTIYDDVWRVISIIVLLTLMILMAIEQKYNPFSIKGFLDVKKSENS